MSNVTENMTAVGEVRLIHGSSAAMSDLIDDSVDLIVTSPPYYSPITEQKLDRGISEKDDLDELNQEIQIFAWSLTGAFEEAQRVLRSGGCLVLQTRDVRLRHILSPVESIHRQIIEATGLRLYTKHFWMPLHQTLSRRRLSSGLVKRYGPIGNDAEVFLVFIKPGGVMRHTFSSADAELLLTSLKRSSSSRSKLHHRYPSPANVIKSLIRCYSRPSDLVLDLFTGGGTTLIAARELGRHAIGYEIDFEALDLARRVIKDSSSFHEGKDPVL
jgi:site-specific DNA-methyltransferase (adenine-specific)